MTWEFITRGEIDTVTGVERIIRGVDMNGWYLGVLQYITAVMSWVSWTTNSLQQN